MSLPKKPGRYYWSTWGIWVDVYKKKGQRYLYVTPPGGIPVLVSPRIAGTFFKLGGDK